MKIVSTFHQSSSVLSSVKCRLFSRNHEHLVVAKLNRIDVYSLKIHGLEHECSLNVRGKICSVKAIQLSDYDPRSNIVVMLTHPEPELLILAYEVRDGEPQLILQKQLSLFERLPRTSEFFNDFIIHSSGKVAVVSCYAGKLKVVTFKGGNYAEDFDVSLPETNVFSIAFLPSRDEIYGLAILHLDAQERLQLSSRDLDVAGLELSQQLSVLLQATLIYENVVPFPTDSPPMLIPVQPEYFEDSVGPPDLFLGGVILVGGKEILLFELASIESQEKQKGKQKRLEAKKKSADSDEVARARAKEQERGSKRKKPKASVPWPWSDVSAWCVIDQTRFLVGDSFGRLAMLCVENITEQGLILIPLGEASPATTLSYLTNQVLYVGSHLGDSQLLQISPSPFNQEKPSLNLPSEIKTVSTGSLMGTTKKGKEKAIVTDDSMDIDDDESADDYSTGRIVEVQGSFVTVLDSYKNIAPVMDAILVDTDGSGQNQIVTCSGAANTGSVNIVRNGADFKELAVVPGLTEVSNLWPVRARYYDTNDTHILVSTLNESHLVQINDSGNNIVFKTSTTENISGFVFSQPTLAFSNFCKKDHGVYSDSYLAVQVVPTGAFLLEWDITIGAYLERASWKVKNTSRGNSRPLEIVAASVNASQVALALTGGNVVLLCIEENAIQFKQIQTISTQSEISAISFLPLDPKDKYSTNLIISYWSLNTVEIFRYSKESNFKSDNYKRSPVLPAVVRSLLLYNFGSDTKPKGVDYHSYLLAGLGDGSVASMLWKDNTLSDLKIFSLGHAPVSLTPCEVEGRKSVLAAGNKATVFFFDKNRLANSPIMLKEISASSKLNTRSFTSSLIVAASSGLFIGRVQDLNKMHIRSAFLGLDNPRQIIYEPSLKVFGVACTRVEPHRVGGYESSRSSFHLLDDNTLARLGQYNSEYDEEIASVESFRTSVENQLRPFFCLGTMVFRSDEKEPKEGRLLIFSTTPSSKASSLELSLVASTDVKGCVYALKCVEGKIVAAVNSSILLYELSASFEESQSPVFTLKKLADWKHNYLVTSLGSFNDRIVAGDQISSVSSLKVKGNKLVTEARDYGPLYPFAVEAINAKEVVTSNDTFNLNLFTLGERLSGDILESIGCYYLADMVSKFLRGSLLTTDSNTKVSILNPEIIFLTTSGKIGVIIDVQDTELSLHLTELQRNMAAVINGIGAASHTRFRAPKNTRGSSDADQTAYGFLDGDFIEQYLEILGKPDLLSRVMKGASAPEELKSTPDEIVKTLEQLQGLH